MTTIYADNFTDYTTASSASMIENGWAISEGSSCTTYSTPNIRTGVNSYRATFYTMSQRTISGSGSAVLASCAFYPNAMPTAGTYVNLFTLIDSSNGIFMDFRVYGDGEIGIVNGSTLHKTSGAAITSGSWFWFQCKVVISNSTGSVQVKNSNGTTILNATGIDTQPGVPTFPSVLRIGGTISASSTSTIQVTDMHIWDSTGSICNDFTEATQIDNLYPDGAGASTQWTASSGSNWQCVDEVPASKTDFVSTSASNDTYADLYTFGNLSETPSEIYSVVATTFANRNNAGAGQLKLLSRSGSTTSTGSSQALPANGSARLLQVFEADPDTSSEWTAAGVNGAQFGFEVDS